jgi:hypothetical protein
MTVLTPTKGSLNITSHPVMGAEVYIDGADYKVTTSGATLITDIPPGTHSYVLKLVGYTDSTGTFSITAGLTTSLDILMVPLTTIGSVQINSTPSGAKVFIGGNDTSKLTPASVLNLGVGGHNYKLTLSGYQDQSGDFTITAGAITTVDVTLVAIPPATGTLNILSVPANAKVVVDGKDTGKVTPAIIDGLSVGNHTYLLTLVGYKDSSAIVNIAAGYTKTVSINLELIAGVTPPGGGGGGTSTATIALLGIGVAAVVMLSGKKE